MSRLVDSKDIVELQLKQMDCEILIRKKEALPQPPNPAPVFYAPPPAYQSPQQLLPQSPPTPAPVVSSPSSTTSAPAPTKSKSSHPPFKCPMAGNFYRCPAPGAPPFVKVCLKCMHACMHTWIYLSMFTHSIYVLSIYALLCLVCTQYVCLKRLSQFLIFCT